jgi:hypothetical protein
MADEDREHEDSEPPAAICYDFAPVAQGRPFGEAD